MPFPSRHILQQLIILTKVTRPGLLRAVLLCVQAKELLSKNLENCIQSLDSTKQDMYFLRDQITITEVSIARVYNFDVKRRRETKKDEMDS
eukprot:5480260-Pyramimonas_sp.AAC.4